MILSTRVKSKGEPEIFCAIPSLFLSKIFNVAALIGRRAINERAFVEPLFSAEARRERFARRQNAFFVFFRAKREKNGARALAQTGVRRYN